MKQSRQIIPIFNINLNREIMPVWPHSAQINFYLMGEYRKTMPEETAIVETAIICPKTSVILKEYSLNTTKLLEFGCRCPTLFTLKT